MLFGLIILLLIAVVAYFHWLQGFFSATLSAILSFAAAVLALGWYEPVVDLTLKGGLGDQAHAAVLVGLYALIYIGLRFLFDGIVPGNVRVPVLVDKIGGAVMGVVAAIFATGILVIAAQELPFGPSIMGYARIDTQSAGTTVVKGGRQDVDAPLDDVVRAPTLDARYSSTLLIPVDDIVVGSVRALSDGGSLAGSQPLADVHPNFLNELFGQRIGLQPGSLHTAFNPPGQEQVKILGSYRLDLAQQADAQSPNTAKSLQNYFSKLPSPLADDFKRSWGDLGKARRPGKDSLLLVIRVQVDHNISDPTNMVALSPGSVTLIASQTAYHPIGTYREGTIYRNRIDDPIFIPVKDGPGFADFVFDVKSDDVAATDSKRTSVVFKPGVFMVFKRLARLPLSGVIKATVDPAPNHPVLLQNGVVSP